jgi:hypothetical protein
LSNITRHRQLGIPPDEPNQLLARFHSPVLACTSAPVQSHQPTQRALMQAQIPSHLPNRLARVSDNPNPRPL